MNVTCMAGYVALEHGVSCLCDGPCRSIHEAWFWSVGIMASLDTCFPDFGGVAMSDTVTSSNESMLRNFLTISQFLYCRVIM